MKRIRTSILLIGAFLPLLIFISSFLVLTLVLGSKIAKIRFQTYATVSSNLNPTPAVGKFVGGSNYVMISIGNYKNTCQGWYEGELKPTIGFYHEEQQKVREQLKTMYDGGQRRIVLFLWYMHFDEGIADRSVWGHVLKSNGGNLVPQHQENLKNLIGDIKATGYEEVIFRFGTQGPSDPLGWSAWNENLYQENWNLILNTRKIVNSAWCGNENSCNGAGLLYDLGAELAGLEIGQTVNYTKRLWTNYVYDAGLGKKDTFGFSFAGGIARRVYVMLDVYDSSPAGRPSLYALDLYENAESQFKEAHNAFRQSGASSEPFIILESFYNDEMEMQQLRRAIQATGREVLFLAQWPLIRDYTCPHFWADYPKDYYNYLAGTVSADPNHLKLSPGIIGTTVISWNTPIFSTAQVWVSLNDQEEKLFAQGKSGSQEANWIVAPNTYTFKLYAGTEHSQLLAQTMVTTEFAPFSLSAGWNQITWPDIVGYTASPALADIDIDCGAGTGIAIATKEKDWWEDYIKNYGGRNFDLQNNQNYFINVSKDCSWRP